MEIRKTIRVFLASSEEMNDDRNAFGNLIRRLDDIYEKRGIRIKLFEWEDYDAAYNDKRKQDEYNENVRKSDMFLAMFHTKAGKFTIEEFDVASEEFRKKALPKIYTYCRDLKEGETESEELKEFKQKLFDEMGHYWCRYDNSDSLKLHFLMQLQLVEEAGKDSLKVENGNVTLDGTTFARMDNLRFAADNEEYASMQRQLIEYSEEIEAVRLRLAEFPDDEVFQNDLQDLLNKRNALRKEFEEQQTFILEAAMRITQMQGRRVTGRMRRAMDAFNAGRTKDANVILTEAEHDADQILKEYLHSKAVTEQKRQNVHLLIDELLLKTSITMADATIPIAERIKQTEALYEKADKMAEEAEYEKEKYYHLLYNWGVFLFKFSQYDRSINVLRKCYEVNKELCPPDDSDLFDKYYYILKSASLYGDIASCYGNLRDQKKSMEYHKLSLELFEMAKSKSDMAVGYDNIGMDYMLINDSEKGLEFFNKALSLKKNLYGTNDKRTAWTYTNIGYAQEELENYDKAEGSLKQALDIQKKIYGYDHPDTARTLYCLGMNYFKLNRDEDALDCLKQSLSIREKVLGRRHPDTGWSFYLLGLYYQAIENYPLSLKYVENAVEAMDKTYGHDNEITKQVIETYNDLKKKLILDN